MNKVNYFIDSQDFSDFFMPTIDEIKKLGAKKNQKNLKILIDLFDKPFSIELKREIASSIGRQEDNDMIYLFLKKNAFKPNFMEVIYQFFRTTLYKAKIDYRFADLRDELLAYYNNEVMHKMKQYYDYRQNRNINRKTQSQITKPTLLIGDNRETLKKINNKQVQLVFTSPPYYNARLYSDYPNYATYLNTMYETLLECNRILEDGRFILINVSPVITKRPGREFESIRYPIHFDFHQLLLKAGFYFIDEIIWIKPEYAVPNRIAGYLQSKKPLSYKPNCISESIMVYRKNSPFLLDKNINKYDNFRNTAESIDSTNCWYIMPKSDKNHPAVFPEELCYRVLKYYSYPGDVVCDPFAGSGTFGRVARSMDRIPILCEQNLNYVKQLQKGGFYEI